MSRLEELGINIGLSVAGFFGSLVVLGKNGIQDLKTTLISMFAGVASANYLTPVVCDLANIEKINHQFSVAFIMGFLGLHGVEKIVKSLFKRINNESIGTPDPSGSDTQ
jgi:hypothetical protein